MFRNVVIDGIDIDTHSSFLDANEYYGVTNRVTGTRFSRPMAMRRITKIK
ncbi:hypothetical protein [Leucobacter komagatae]|nr:hypothetical protein [Leucobacter komagatae]